jgi:hypothetical protein
MKIGKLRIFSNIFISETEVDQVFHDLTQDPKLFSVTPSESNSVPKMQFSTKTFFLSKVKPEEFLIDDCTLDHQQQQQHHIFLEKFFIHFIIDMFIHV